MSWQAYVDTSLVGSGSIDKAAIFSADGKGAWAYTKDFSVTTKEMEQVVQAYADKSDVKQVQASGLHIGGEKFVVLKADDRSLYGKKGKEGIVIVKTVQTILVAHYPETSQPGVVSNVVETLADHLIKSGY